MKQPIRSTLDAVLIAILFGCAWLLLMQLVSIPASMAVDVPKHLDCQFYASWRSRWGCAAFGDPVSSPHISLLALATTVAAFGGLRYGRALKLPVRALVPVLAAQMCFACDAGALVRTLSVITGAADMAYLQNSALLAAISIASFFAMRFAVPSFEVRSIADDKRREQQQQSIDQEIQERLAERKRGGKEEV